MRKEAEETVRKGFFRPLDKHVNHLLTETHTYTHACTFSAEVNSNCFSDRSSLTVDTATMLPPTFTTAEREREQPEVFY